MLHTPPALHHPAASRSAFVRPAAMSVKAPGKPIYVHMNGANMFLERTVFAAPGQTVIFVNEDTGGHTIIGYNPVTGATSKRFDGAVAGTKGAGHKVATYSISFKHQGIHDYYCSVHAIIAQEPGDRFVAKVRPGVHGFGDPMAGRIIVTTDPKLLAENPASTHTKILPGYFGG
jgi:plastocyanin